MEKAKTRKALVNATEKRVLEWLKENGYWAHLMLQGANGQPCDIIAVKEGKATLIDAKHCATKRFSLSRIEANQATSFDYAKKFGMECAFVCEHEGKLYVLKWDDVLRQRDLPSIELREEDRLK